MTARRVVLDTDVLSIFAKVEELQLLEALFGKGKLLVTPVIYQELMVPLSYGYHFPEKVFTVGTLTLLTIEEKQFAVDLQRRNQRPGEGEAEALSLCKARQWLFVSNDAAALRSVHVENCPYMGLEPLFRLLWTREVITKQDTFLLLQRATHADRSVFSPAFRKEVFTEESTE